MTIPKPFLALLAAVAVVVSAVAAFAQSAPAAPPARAEQAKVQPPAGGASGQAPQGQAPAAPSPNAQKPGQKPADAKNAKAPAVKQAVAAPPAPAVPPPPPGYVIGPDDVLSVLFRYDKDLTTDVVVRPDGMISLPMLSDVQAAGLTPEQLRDKVAESAKRFIEDPAVTVIVKTINSRKVFITGQVAKPGPYPLMGPTTVLQLIAMAGGLSEFADEKGITVMRTDDGKPVSFPFNYKDVTKRKNLKQNIELRPGDTVIVP